MSILSFILYCFIVTVTPGPTNIVILSTVQKDGVRSAMIFTYGSVFGFGLLLASSALLNSFFVHLIPNILSFLQVVGSIYLLYLAYQVYKMDASKDSKLKGAGSFSFGLFLQFLNPKPILFALTLFPSFVLPYYQDTFSLIVAVLGITIIGFISFLLWVVFGAVFKELLRKYNKIANVIMAVFLIYAAGMIWV